MDDPADDGARRCVIRRMFPGGAAVTERWNRKQGVGCCGARKKVAAAVTDILFTM